MHTLNTAQHRSTLPVAAYTLSTHTDPRHVYTYRVQCGVIKLYVLNDLGTATALGPCDAQPSTGKETDRQRVIQEYTNVPDIMVT